MTKNQAKHLKEEAADISAAPEDGIGSRIRSARESRGFSQTAVSARTKMNDPKGQGISRTVLVGYEAGHSKPGAREIRMLCECLSVTANWIIFGAEESHQAQASLEAFRNGNDLISALRLALAISVLRPHERGAFTSLVLSAAGRELGDMKLSALLVLANQMTEPVLEQIKQGMPDDFSAKTSTVQTLDAMVRANSEGFTTNFGNRLFLNEDGDPIGGEWLYPEPKK
ncbi:helix-turn-helix domain-containing protein [Massilia sp. TWR1-2-2]|uniref:helix-turn-helix domain-containing protein n=1 Tax=Massilia sp. TWR1-2-2 TaxID=2804584 RepID=UPI003CE79E21